MGAPARISDRSPSDRPRWLKGLVLALPFAMPPLAAQQPPASTAVAEALYVKLNNLAAYEAAAQATQGAYRFEAGSMRWRTEAASPMVVLDASDTGWSAIALSEGPSGLRCGIRIGSAPPVLGESAEVRKPVCVDSVGAPIAIRLRPNDARLLYWSRDLALSQAATPNGCPPLGLFERPKNNDTLQLAYVVGTDGRPEPDGAVVGATGSLDEVTAGLMWLDKCTFHPGAIGDTPVRTLMQQTIALSPNPKHPAKRSGAEATQHDHISARVARSIVRMEATLRDLAARPAVHSRPGVWAAVFRWDSAGFQAVAWADSADGARCFIASGDMIGKMLGSVQVSATPACAYGNGVAIPEDAAGADSGEMADVVEPGVDRIPKLKECSSFRHLSRDRHRLFSTVVELVIGKNGRPEPDMFRIVQAARFWDAAVTAQYLEGCRYSPGVLRGRPIAVVVRQPFNYKGER